ncbi:hypothetical protein JXA88_07650 [Candidatus Fermentibacteria bacterium]|nr:hypothetical protein [Candidatus Fermentibacteria bacterium]
MRAARFLAVLLPVHVALAVPGPPAPSSIQLQSSWEGNVSRIILVYSQTAEVGLASMIDILEALPHEQAIIINQFALSSPSFEIFSSTLAQGRKGATGAKRPNLYFVQDARAYGPWPRDQAVVDAAGRMWVSAGDHHQLRPVFDSLDETYGIERHDLPLEFAGANLLSCGSVVLHPDRLDVSALEEVLEGTLVALPSPPLPERFHLDLLVMPLSDSLVVVGDDGMARTVLEALTPEECTAIVARWSAEFAASAGNMDYAVRGGRLSFRRNMKPALILWPFIRDKLRLLASLAPPEAFAAAVQQQPPYEWDDRIAEALRTRGFTVVRVPFWPGSIHSPNRHTPHLPTIAYPNCLVWDDGIIMPVYGITALDSVATRVYRRVSGRTVHHMRGGAILGFGSSGPHCLTLEFRE